ncbi:RseA family anti-sigma factor [Photobacterium alginatilyticum]|uniref:Anti-sigma-E factor RseA n=1 Tax=Photobacterium alginatilyticum TaxID=1775171 RepID=A0ABW9YKK6_9GAMM|nr:RseA family anti-sigma factor [Photobacterium alginatilyticum]NBI54369.1 anti-sigma E factor [Photobacterium alginatilyticum]
MADKQKISALLDGEELDQSIINALAVDDDSQQTWQHFNLIGDVMRGEAPQNKDWDIAASVAMALENEPAHTGVSEPAQVVQLATVRETAEPQPTPQQAKRTLPAWLTQFGQVAVAACVSLAVIVGVQQYNGGDDGVVSNPADSQIPVLQTIPFAGTAEPVSLTRDSVRSNSHAAPSEAQVMEQRRRINAMLQDYELQLRLNAEDGSIDKTLLETN